MKIHFIIAFIASLVILGFLVYKILKANNLLIPFKEFKKRWRVEGETVYTWTYTPPLWQRVLGSLSVIIPGAAMIILWHHKEERIWYYLCFIITMILIVGVSELRPRIYRLTDQGVWRRYGWLFSNAQKLTLTSTSTSTGKEERLIRWEEISAVKIKKNKLLLNRKVTEPSTQEFLALPSWMLSGFRRIEICFNQEDKRVSQLIKDYTDKKQ
ncbi:MAG: hypothetical protein JSV88_22290 [Candidatus Aminicenantes bacterium]|nr:MAG: hypothetical protein JSV88_22290 [Candidatus Aminicenantes bacterium]